MSRSILEDGREDRFDCLDEEPGEMYWAKKAVPSPWYSLRAVGVEGDDDYTEYTRAGF